MKEENDRLYMERALHLAEQGRGRVSPNPMVGAVLVKEGRIIGEGFHACYGGLHAERAALESCREAPQGSTLYVTLEPCCHYGKQPPCTDAVLENGIRRVVVGSGDPNPLVAGKGIEKVKAGISICIFPEGTRSKSEDETELLPFKEGSMKMASKTGCPIIPMAITGSADIFENHFPWIRSADVRLVYGEPIYPGELSKEDQKRLGSYTRLKILELLKGD